MQSASLIDDRAQLIDLIACFQSQSRLDSQNKKIMSDIDAAIRDKSNGDHVVQI
jgi:hypothetical protein